VTREGKLLELSSNYLAAATRRTTRKTTPTSPNRMIPVRVLLAIMFTT